MRHRRAGALAAALLLLASAACSKSSPAGQAVAVVDGAEITRLDIDQELAQMPPAPGADGAARRQAALRAVIDRKLLVKLAHDQKLDAAPAMLAAIQRSQDAVLAAAATDWLTGSPPQIDDDAAAAYLRNHPEFGHPVLYAVDQIAFPRPQAPDLVRKIGEAPTLDAIQDLLNLAGISGERSYGTWTSISMPSELVKRIAASDDKEPLVFSTGPGTMLAGVRLTERSLSPGDDQLRTIATRALQQQAQAARVNSWMEAARKSATVTYIDASVAPAKSPPTN